MPDLPALFLAEEGPLLGYAFGLLGRREVAEEVVQEAFLRLHREGGGIGNPRAWLYRCVRNLSLNEIRDHKRESPGGEDPPELPDDSRRTPDEELGRHEAIGTLRLLMAEMDPEDARLLHLKYREDRSYATIAAVTGLNIGTVGYELHHILKSLAHALRRAGIESPEG